MRKCVHFFYHKFVLYQICLMYSLNIACHWLSSIVVASSKL